MRDFEEIKPQIEELKGKIHQAEIEMNFVQTIEKPLQLKIQPRWLILFVVAVFFIECMRAAANRKFEISWITWIVVGVVIVSYVVYAVVMSLRHKDHVKEASAAYETKRAIYETLQAQKRETFEKYVAESGGIRAEYADENRAVYLWKDEKELTIVRLTDDIEQENVPCEDINYISSDENLGEYAKALGEEETIDKSVPYCYIFTKNKTYIFNVASYDNILSLLPAYELKNKLGKS